MSFEAMEFLTARTPTKIKTLRDEIRCAHYTWCQLSFKLTNFTK